MTKTRMIEIIKNIPSSKIQKKEKIEAVKKFVMESCYEKVTKEELYNAIVYFVYEYGDERTSVPIEVYKRDEFIDFDDIIHTRQGLCGKCGQMVIEEKHNFCPRCGYMILWG